MGFFGKKKEAVSENSEEFVLKKDLELEVEKLQGEFRTKQEELNEYSQKIDTVKEEYNNTVSNLMLVKKELNQKKMELDVLQKEYKEIKEKIKNSEEIKDSETTSKFNKTRENLSKIKQELEDVTKEHNAIKEELLQEQAILRSIKAQQAESQKELEEANSRLFNAKEELGKKDIFQDTSVLTSKEKQFIQGNNSSRDSAGVIEAASVVVGSLKSKLNMTQKELEAVQLLLEKERNEHERTKLELETLKKSLDKS